MSWRAATLGLLGVAGLGAAWANLPEDATVKQPATWQSLASPGDLSPAHAFLEDDCSACHTPNRGATRDRCVTCHANERAVLERQPTAFHASISSCHECHAEHRAFRSPRVAMDHDALARIGLEELRGAPSDVLALRSWLEAAGTDGPPMTHPAGETAPTPLEQTLDCMNCHALQDRHVGLMGTDCVACHATTTWTLPTFRHPSPESRDCAQCHQAPPSHYMGHFKMVSAQVARKPHADVRQCFECHRTTSWNDIPGVGRYKHH